MDDFKESQNQLGDSSSEFLADEGQARSASGLSPFWDLFSETFRIYKKRIWTFLGLEAIPFAVYFIFLAVFGVATFSSLGFSAIFGEAGLKIGAGIMAIVLFFWLFSIILNFWVSASLVFAIKERGQKIGVKESLGKGRNKLISYIWVSFLGGIIVFGGFLFFIIPGVIFGILFSMAAYVLICEGLRGGSALQRSKELVSGNWWEVFGKIVFFSFILWIVSAVLGAFFSFIFQPASIIINFAIIPLPVIFSFLIYEDLKKIKGVRAEGHSAGLDKKYVIISILGFLLIPAILSISLF